MYMCTNWASPWLVRMPNSEKIVFWPKNRLRTFEQLSHFIPTFLALTVKRAPSNQTSDQCPFFKEPHFSPLFYSWVRIVFPLVNLSQSPDLDSRFPRTLSESSLGDPTTSSMSTLDKRSKFFLKMWCLFPALPLSAEEIGGAIIRKVTVVRISVGTCFSGFATVCLLPFLVLLYIFFQPNNFRAGEAQRETWMVTYKLAGRTNYRGGYSLSNRNCTNHKFSFTLCLSNVTYLLRVKRSPFK